MTSPFAARRRRLMAEMATQAVMILPAANLQLRNGDSHYRFRQDSDFWYLTGFGEPDGVLVLAPGRDRKVILFVRPRDKEREVWDGRRAGVEGAVELYGADEAFPIGELDSQLPTLLEQSTDLYYSLGKDRGWDARIVAWLECVRQQERKGTVVPRRVLDPRELMAEMRLRKQPEEIDLVRRAVSVTAGAHLVAMDMAREGVWEYEVEAAIEYAFRRGGASGPGYTTIVGSGPNATILHYIENRARLADGQLLLVDAGAELDHYTADVTRTFPVGGPFRPAARRVYQAVLEAQQEAIRAAEVGGTLETIHARTVEVLVEHLREMKLLGESQAQAIEEGSYKRFYMHRTSHWLGIDVHDVGRYYVAGKPRPLEPGFLFTIEPGLYIAEDATDVPEEYRGIGVRIEDDILVTEKGVEVLTAAIPKQPDELERIVGRRAS